MRITSKGRVMTVEFVPAGRHKNMSRSERLVESMRGGGNIKLTTDQIMKMTRR